MYYGKKKGIIITVVIIILVILLALGGLIVYSKTDLLKSKDTLFYKYLGQTLKDLEVSENTQLATIEKLKEQVPYQINGELTFEDSKESNPLNNVKLIVDAKVDKISDKAYATTELYNRENSIFKLEYANANNIYALKSNEIVTAFVGVENNNLKALAQKLGIENAKDIPDEIQFLGFAELLDFTEDEKTYITETYMNIIRQNIEKKSYSKENDVTIIKDGVNHKTTGYRLNLTASELKNLEVKLLENLKQDSITLNLITTKAKTLGLSENYTQVNNLTQQIQEKIDTIQNGSSLEETGLSIVIYVENGKVITNEIIIKNDTKLTISIDKNNNISNYYILIEKLNMQEQFNKIELQIQRVVGTMETSLNAQVNIDDKTEVDIYLQNTGSASENYLNSNLDVTVTQNDRTYEGKYSQKMNFKQDVGTQIPVITRNNCAVLNDYTKQQIEFLIKSITERVIVVFNEKIQIIDSNINPTIVNE